MKKKQLKYFLIESIDSMYYNKVYVQDVFNNEDQILLKRYEDLEETLYWEFMNKSTMTLDDECSVPYRVKEISEEEALMMILLN
jgi:hypothetical protein